MKKAIIAGAASAVLAAMPVVGVFAVNTNPAGTPKTDTLVLTVDDYCTLYRGATYNAAGTASDAHTARNYADAGDTAIQGTWSITGSSNPVAPATSATSANDTFTMTVVPNNTYDGIATSTFNVTCNEAAGYHVTVATSAFEDSGQEGEAAWAYNAGGYSANTDAAGDVVSSWYLTSSAKKTGDDVFNSIANNGDVWTLPAGGTVIGTQSFDITYNVKVSPTQDKGTYTATAVYTLEKL